MRCWSSSTRHRCWTSLSRSNLFLAPLDDEDGWYRFHPLFARLLQVELERREPGLAPALHRRAYAWHRDQGTTSEAILHAIGAGAHAEAAELIEASWVRYANACKYATVLGWIRRFPDEVLSGDVRLLLVAAWVLSLSARRGEAARAIAAVEELGETGRERAAPGRLQLGRGEPDACYGPSSRGATSAPSWNTAAARQSSKAPGRRGGRWPAGRLAWAGTGGASLGEADRSFAESVALAPASGQWLAAASSLGYRSLIAGDAGASGRPAAAGRTGHRTRGGARHRGNGRRGTAGPRGIVRTARKAGAGTASYRSRRRRLAVSGPAHRPGEGTAAPGAGAAPAGERERSQAAIAEARFIIESCPDPGILAGRLKASEPCPRPGPRSADEKLTDRELRVLRLLTSDLSERDIGQQLYVSHNTVHSHVRSIYRKLGVSSRAHAVERTRELKTPSRRRGTRSRPLSPRWKRPSGGDRSPA